MNDLWEKNNIGKLGCLLILKVQEKKKSAEVDLSAGGTRTKLYWGSKPSSVPHREVSILVWAAVWEQTGCCMPVQPHPERSPLPKDTPRRETLSHGTSLSPWETTAPWIGYSAKPKASISYRLCSLSYKTSHDFPVKYITFEAAIIVMILSLAEQKYANSPNTSSHRAEASMWVWLVIQNCL